jgi:uncharacterized protein (DUF1800 family)
VKDGARGAILKVRSACVTFKTRIANLPYSPELADIRFGCGLSPNISRPASPEVLLDGLDGPDRMAQRFPIGGFDSLRLRLQIRAELRADSRKSTGNSGARAKIKALSKDSAAEASRNYTQSLLRWIQTDTGFQERLVGFWADHFTARGKNPILKFATAAYIEEAIRPNISGSFGDMLIATTTHPLMLHFLDQNVSVGPQSKAAAKAKKLKGLNENLAREVMELHTLGVGGPYSQSDVRQLAELFTGLSFSRVMGFKYRADFAEPGPETVLGKSYGGDPATLDPVLHALRDLATHPATARHIAQKLAVHFVSDMPDPALVQHIEGRFNDTGGDLRAVCAAMLEHPSSWDTRLDNVKPPADFVASACRALVPDQMQISALAPKRVRRLLMGPLDLMGQPWLRPNGPDGWAEEDAAWITPQGVSTRLRWALSAPQKLRRDLPDPRQFVTATLGSFAPPSVLFAAESAESRSDAIGLVLASPAFQRR